MFRWPRSIARLGAGSVAPRRSAGWLCPAAPLWQPIAASSACCATAAESTTAAIPAGATSSRRWASSLVAHRGQIGAGRLVVEPDRHQGHLMDQAQAVLEAPAEQFAIARR